MNALIAGGHGKACVMSARRRLLLPYVGQDDLDIVRLGVSRCPSITVTTVYLGFYVVVTLSPILLQLWMYYRSGTGVRCSMCARQLFRVYSPGGNTFLNEMTSWPPSWKCDAKSNKKAELSQRWPRDAPYIWVPWKFSWVPDYIHGYIALNF